MAAVLGNECGVLLWGLAAAFGLSALLLASRVAYDALRLTGAVVLVWMGARALWQARRLSSAPADTPAGPPSLRRAFTQGLITNLANPNAGVFASGFLQRPRIRRRMERLCGTLLIGLGVRLAAQP